MPIETLADLHENMRACRRCLEAGYDIAPGAVFSGSAASQVMLIGQAPGVTEALVKRPFNAGSGRRLFQWLEAAGWDEEDFRKRQYMSAVTKCYPGKGASGKGDRVPSKTEQTYCRPFLDREFALVDPRLIIPVGKLALSLFYPSRASLKQLVGTAYYLPAESAIGSLDFSAPSVTRLQKFDPRKPVAGRWLVPLPHPSGASLWPNRPENRALIDRAIVILSDIREAWGL